MLYPHNPPWSCDQEVQYGLSNYAKNYDVNTSTSDSAQLCIGQVPSSA